jgi:hypothetical protein
MTLNYHICNIDRHSRIDADDVKGEGNQQDYGFRIYDPRVARFLSVDPLSPDYPWYTSY